MPRTVIIRVAGSVLLLTVLIICVRVFDLMEFISGEALRSSIEGYGMLAPLVYIGGYAVATMVFVPGSALTLAGGALFGPLFGTMYTVVGASLGATLAFFFARYLRGGKSLVKTSSTLSTPQSGRCILDELVSVGKWTSLLASYDARIKARGLATVLFLRLVPLFPFNALNYGLGLTSVKARDYFIGTLLGIIPGTFVFTYFGDALVMLQIGHVVGAVMLFGIMTLIGRYLLKRYGQALGG